MLKAIKKLHDISIQNIFKSLNQNKTKVFNKP